MIKLLECFQTSENENEIKTRQLLNQKNERGFFFEISHFCKALKLDLCIEPSHFCMKFKSINDRRKGHQNEIYLCNCADFNDKPYLINLEIDEKIYDEIIKKHIE